MSNVVLLLLCVDLNKKNESSVKIAELVAFGTLIWYTRAPHFSGQRPNDLSVHSTSASQKQYQTRSTLGTC